VHDDEDEMTAEEEIPDLDKVAAPDARRLVLEEG
jgi:hypothetical protein